MQSSSSVAETLIAALRNGRLPHDGVPAGLIDGGLWDGDALERLLRALHERNAAGHLGDEELAELCRTIDRWSRSTPGRDPDATEELATPTSPLTPAPLAAIRTGVSDVCRGTVLRDRYLIEENVGCGGMSLVFRARDLRRDPDDPGDAAGIAIKVLRPEWRGSASANARLKREFRQTRVLRHPGTVRMFDLDREDDVWFITMEMLTGTALDARLKSLAPIPIDPAEAMRIVAGCAEVLGFAHDCGVLHGDFKPGNVLLADDGRVKVLDFGGSPEAGDADFERDGSRVATRAYASPEVLAQETAEPRDDVFSLACVSYELLSGRHPFKRLPATRARELSLAPAPLPQLSSAQNAALARGLAFRRSDRPATVRDFLHQLERSGAPSARAPAGPDEPEDSGRPGATVRSWPKLRLGAALAAAVVATALVLIAIWRPLAPGARDVAAPLAESASGAASRAVPGVPAPGVSPGLARPRTAAPIRSAATAIPTSEPAVSSVSAPTEPVESVSSGLSPGPPPAPTPTSVAPRRRAQVAADRPSVVVTEGTHAAVVLLHRQANLATTVQVAWQLSSGTARLHEDFGGPTTGTTRFLPGQATRAIYIPLIDDTTVEADESFSLSLSSRSAAIGPTQEVTITIVDDDDDDDE